MTKRVMLVLGLAVLLLGLTTVAVWPQLSARVQGTEYRATVAPLDPVDPFRGAYVQLTYPDLRAPWEGPTGGEPAERSSGRVYLRLEEVDGLLHTTERVRTRPDEGPYLACESDGWSTTCGIESWFLPQAGAKALEERVAGGTAVAVIRIDGRGNAALVDVE